jgi:hypothetical protein
MWKAGVGRTDFISGRMGGNGRFNFAATLRLVQIADLAARKAGGWDIRARTLRRRNDWRAVPALHSLLKLFRLLRIQAAELILYVEPQFLAILQKNFGIDV